MTRIKLSVDLRQAIRQRVQIQYGNRARQIRDKASQVQPNLQIRNMLHFSVNIASYLIRPIDYHASASFANLVQTKERIKDGMKTRKIKEYQILFEQASSSSRGSTKKGFPSKRNKKNKKKVYIISGQIPWPQSSYIQAATGYQLSSLPSTLPSSYPLRTLYPPIAVLPSSRATTPPYPQNSATNYHQQYRPSSKPPNNSKKVSRNFSLLQKPLSQLFQKC